MYRSVRTKSSEPTTDEYINDLSKTKENLIENFFDAMKEAAIDCELYKAHNMLNQKYECFKFKESSLFVNNIGPAYKRDIQDDMRFNDGLNDTNAQVLHIKVIKIKAVKLLSHPDEEPVYSETEYYWYYPKTRVVYDYDLHFVVGRVGINEDGIPLKLDGETYIIDYVIPIPLVNN